jgi:hypothetical protein
MYNLLNYLIQGQQTGEDIYDPYGQTPSQQEMLDLYNITLTDPATLGLAPTPDEKAKEFVHGQYRLGEEGRISGARGALGKIGAGQRYSQAQSGFASPFMTDTTRQDVLKATGQAGEAAYLGLQRDIYDIDRGYQEDFLSFIGGLDPDMYEIGDQTATVTEEQTACEDACGEQLTACMESTTNLGWSQCQTIYTDCTSNCT